MPKLTGDPDGIAAFKELVADNRDFFRFLVGEAETNVEKTAPFTAKSGKKYVLKVVQESGTLEVAPEAPPAG